MVGSLNRSEFAYNVLVVRGEVAETREVAQGFFIFAFLNEIARRLVLKEG